MRTFKLIDYIIQIALIGGTFIIMGVKLISGEDIGYEIIFPSYFYVGGWQLISVAIHAFAKYKSKLRKMYLKMLLVTVIVGIVCIATIIAGVYYLAALLFWSPILAILYLITCIKETNWLRQSLAL
jgi:hypothetical protein